MGVQTAVSSAAASRPSASLSPKSGMGAAINCISELVHRLLELVDLLEQASRMTSVLILSLLERCILVGRGDVAGRWCVWRAAERSGHGMAAMSP
jgi:hypothetical protein